MDDGAAIIAEAISLENLSEPASKFCAHAAVRRRYANAAIENGKPILDAVPFLLSTAKWRDEWRVDSMLTDAHLLSFENELQAVLLYSLSVDERERPLLIERVGAWNVSTLLATVSAHSEDVLRAHVLVTERIRLAVDAAAVRGSEGGVDPRAVCVFDTAGMPWSLLRQPSLLSHFAQTARLDAAHFPDTMGTIIIVNVSRVAKAMWWLIAPLIAPQTRQKVHVFSWSQEAQAHAMLRELCGVGALPAELGGRQERGSLAYRHDCL